MRTIEPSWAFSQNVPADQIKPVYFFGGEVGAAVATSGQQSEMRGDARTLSDTQVIKL